ncbi:2-amino-4-hydroxy-6-hydroxymethyldihydropteridine diphosphokinase [candidate division WOR-3 bacterium]|nr:2-amino-4-hydroxy-6-hydroxymethyldihydropteridine diphosphokinase [candidate division WOR-3 bacterium]
MDNLVYLGIGSNLGDRLENIKQAIKKLSAFGKIKAVSSIWETEPWGYLPQPFFLNSVILFNWQASRFIGTRYSAFELLEKISEIEKGMGRRRGKKFGLFRREVTPDGTRKTPDGTIKFGPRIIDIDILFYNNLILPTSRQARREAELIIPHPRVHERKFVLLPLSEIAPNLIHPVLNKTINGLIEGLGDSGGYCQIFLSRERFSLTIG